MPSTFTQLVANGGPNGLPALDANLLGARFIQQCTARSLDPNAPGDMAQINEDFHDVLRGAGWQWAPATSGNTEGAGARLLDGTARSGECAFVAHALRILLNQRRP